MLPGDWLGRYKIVSKIGAGGMGEVYLAEDPKLDRLIALKILPAGVAEDTERMRRFVHEAKSASALNHPNIITIYEINDEHDVPFIAMEYVVGETLAKRIKRRDSDLQKTLDIAIQIAGALAAAHDANVIHRDIKPDNVIIRPDGLVKVLDFGLAKLAEKPESVDLEAQTTTFVLTSPGLVMGTIGYMSPEQARGKQVDARSDIFGFGTMLYQMLAGKLPFPGDNNADIVASILHKEPIPLSEAVPEIPHDLEALVRKMLRKNRDERYQTVRELLADLRDLRDDLEFENSAGQTYTRLSDSGRAKTTDDGMDRPLTTAEQSGFGTSSISQILFNEIKHHPFRSTATLAGLMAVIVVTGLAIARIVRPDANSEAFQSMRFAKLTSTGNVSSGDIAVSPEGKLIAYVIQEAGEQSLWVKQAATASNVQITSPADVSYNGITFSPDSAFIYYASKERTGVPSVYQVPALGGTPRKLVTDADGPISFSPDGKQFSFVRKANSLMRANAEGGAVQPVVNLSDGKAILRTSWSPDGNTIVAAIFSPTDSNDRLIEIDVKDGSEKPFPSPNWLRLRGVTWLPDTSGVIVSGRDPDTELSQVWLISYPGGQPRRITNDLNNYQGVSLTADGKTAVSTQQIFLSNLWVASVNNPRMSVKITSEVGKDEGMSGVGWAPDGRIVYTTRIKGVQDIWIVNSDGSENRQLTFNARVNHSPTVSPDGRYVVFVSTRAGSPSIWRMDIDGGNPVQLTDNSDAKGAPNISPNGEWVVYQHEDSKRKNTIWKIGINGGTAIQLTTTSAERPVVSPDGQFVACEYGEPTSATLPKLAIIPIDGGRPAHLLDMPLVLKSRIFRWSADGKSMIYFESRDRIDNLWSQPLEGGEPKQLTDFKADRIFRFDISSDGKQFAIARGTDTSDAVMISNFR